MCSLRSRRSGRRQWTEVLFSQPDVKREWLSSTMPRRGRKPTQSEAAKEAMRADIDQKRLAPSQLKDMSGKELAGRYMVSRTTAMSARKAVLKDIDPAGNSISDK
jgi:hypothetical protein